MGPLKQSLIENISLQRCNGNIFGLTDTMALFAKEAGYYRFSAFFRASSLQNEVGDPPFFITFLTSLTHYLSMVKFPGKNQCSKNLARTCWVQTTVKVTIEQTSKRFHKLQFSSICTNVANFIAITDQRSNFKDRCNDRGNSNFSEQ